MVQSIFFFVLNCVTIVIAMRNIGSYYRPVRIIGWVCLPVASLLAGSYLVDIVRAVAR